MVINENPLAVKASKKQTVFN